MILLANLIIYAKNGGDLCAFRLLSGEPDEVAKIVEVIYMRCRELLKFC
jgi:hypothetical protein